MEREHGATLTADRTERTKPRMKNPAMLLPESGPAIQALIAAVHHLQLRHSWCLGLSLCSSGVRRGEILQLVRLFYQASMPDRRSIS